LNVVCIVEGHGDRDALPVLLRRLADRHGRTIDVRPPIRCPRGRLVQQAELSRVVQFAARSVGPGGRILVLLDGDEDCPAELGPRLVAWCEEARSDARLSVVIAAREYEAWFLGAAESIAGRRGLVPQLSSPDDPETIADAKGWLSERMGRRYSPVVDQPALSAVFDIDLARRRCPSFDKLLRDVEAWF